MIDRLSAANFQAKSVETAHIPHEDACSIDRLRLRFLAVTLLQDVAHAKVTPQAGWDLEAPAPWVYPHQKG